MLQVIPTVGVGGQEGEKRRRAMLKHFNRLLDQTSAKARFLQAFEDRQSSDAVLSGMAEQESRELQEEAKEDATKAASEGGEEDAAQLAEGDPLKDLPGHESGTLDTDAAGMKVEDPHEDEVASRKGKTAEGERDTGAGDSEVEISSCEDSSRERAPPPELVNLVDGYGKEHAQRLDRSASGKEAGSHLCVSSTCC